MSRQLNIPYFAAPPEQYSRPYFADLTRAFALFAQQMNTPGTWRATELTLTQETGNTDRGQLSWNIDEETIDITMGDGVVQQVGFETYMRVKNDTGSQIDNGTVVGFVGVNAEIKVAPYIANSSANELYFIGVATHDMPDQDIGPVTLYGKVRGIDTTGPGAETWNVGDILYVSPTTAGLLTNVRPTAPNAVIVVAAVLSVDATDGVIMVRPTVPLGLDYGSFDANVDQTLAAINTATPVALQVTLSSNGVTLSNSSRLNVSQSGFYQIDANIQMASTSASPKTAYFWMRKNGTDVTSTTRAVTSDINNGFVTVALNYTISLQANDYIEIYWAGDDTNLTLDALAASAFAPSSPSVLVKVSQLQL
jgi:hypothetical protein